MRSKIIGLGRFKSGLLWRMQYDPVLPHVLLIRSMTPVTTLSVMRMRKVRQKSRYELAIYNTLRFHILARQGALWMLAETNHFSKLDTSMRVLQTNSITRRKSKKLYCVLPILFTIDILIPVFFFFIFYFFFFFFPLDFQCFVQ